MNIKVICCKVMCRELYYLAYSCKNSIDFVTVPQILHNTPYKLHLELQKIIDDIENEDTKYDAICLGYGLCSNAIVGLRSKHTQIVVPKAHDCISMLLGDRSEFNRVFEKYDGGIYWYTSGWAEAKNDRMPSKDKYVNLYEKYLEKYGDEDTAKFLVETEISWLTNYKAMLFIDWDIFDNTNHIKYTKESADYFDLDFDVLKGQPTILKALLDGNWYSSEFLVVPPTLTITPSYNADIIKFAQEAEKVKRDTSWTN